MNKLKLARCGHCGEKTMRSNPDSYCMSCRTQIRKEIKGEKSKFNLTKSGRYVYDKHKEGLTQHERDYIETNIL